MLFFLTVLSFIGFGAVMAQNGTNPPQDPPQGPPEIIDLPPPGTEQGLRLNEKKPKKKDAVLTTLEDSFKEDLDLSEQPFDP